MKIQNVIILYSLLLGLPVGGWAQTETDSTALERRVRPIESPRFQGTREPSEEEKAYARLLAEEREEQAQIDYTLPLIDENGQVQSPADYYDRISMIRGFTATVADMAHGGSTRD